MNTITVLISTNELKHNMHCISAYKNLSFFDKIIHNYKCYIKLCNTLEHDILYYEYNASKCDKYIYVLECNEYKNGINCIYFLDNKEDMLNKARECIEQYSDIKSNKKYKNRIKKGDYIVRNCYKTNIFLIYYKIKIM